MAGTVATVLANGRQSNVVQNNFFVSVFTCGEYLC